MEKVIPLASAYAIDEVQRNIRNRDQELRFKGLLSNTQIVTEGDLNVLAADIHLVAKDRQILATAIASSAQYLITGDRNHFSHFYGKRVRDVQVVSPAMFLDLYQERL